MTDIAHLGLAIDSAPAGTASASLDKLASSADRAEQSVNKMGQKVSSTLKGTSFQTANLAAQLNDIAVQLQSGQNPFQIALQQGSQINQIIGQQGAKGAFALLKESIVSLINPVSLATIGIIGLGGAAIQYIGQLAGGPAARAEDALKRQKALIDQIAKAWPDAGKSLKAALDQVGAATPNVIVVKSLQEIRDSAALLQSLRSELNNMLANGGGGRGGPTNPLAFQPELLSQIREAVTLFDQGKLSASGLRDHLAGLELQPGLSNGVRALIDRFVELTGKISDADAVTRAFTSNLEYMRAQGGSIIGGDFAQLQGPADLVARLRGMTPDLRSPAQQAKDLYAQNSGLDSDGSGKRQLDFTLKQIALEEKLRSAHQRVGSSVRDLANEYSYLKDDGIQPLIDKAQKLGDTLSGQLTGAVMGVWQAFKSGGNVLDAILNQVGNIADQFLSSSLQTAFSSILTGGLGGGWHIPTGFQPGGFFPAFPHAAGGPILGPGTGTSDSIPAMLSAGEFVVNAKAASAFRPLLDAINNGGAQHLAAGGPVRPVPPTNDNSGPQHFHVTLGVDVDGNGNIMPFVKRVSDASARGAEGRAVAKSQRSLGKWSNETRVYGFTR